MIETLIGSEKIAQRVAGMGKELTDFYSGKDFVMVIIANGGIFFGVDLARSIKLDFPVDIIATASYHNDSQSEELVFRCAPKLSLKGKNVLLVDEVLDSGVTLAKTIDKLYNYGAAEIKTAVLVTKVRSRCDEAVQAADWSGFVLPDVYLVGCGLDSHELYRSLPFLGVVSD